MAVRRHAEHERHKRCFYLLVEAVRTLQLQSSSSSILPHVLMADQANLPLIVLEEKESACLSGVSAVWLLCALITAGRY